ncbi:hypothetical protein [Subtercola lobariae]|uniref:DUF4188 domain-containing protein n=1 Tax=Subtercola lobariae TaxID=1588641 RepID=A0A917B7W7_9MICO|nr:hypothetical protein [Subtercola lobariae]GGF28595.1 hypothetical protein GCM10011399_22200 [Subtercola lobariae]
MRTTDFSKAPAQARAGALLVVELGDAAAAVGPSGDSGATDRALVKQLTSAAGAVWHKKYRRGGGVTGVMVFFGQPRAAEDARATLDRASCSVRLLVAEQSGYSNGVWRAEGNVMAHIEHFTPTSVEAARGTTPPLVAGAAQTHRVTGSGGSPAGTPARTRDSISTETHGTATVRPSNSSRGGRQPDRPVTDARAMFVGATKYRGPRALITLSRTWYPMIARMQKLPGYVWHTIYWQPPFTLGTLTFFADRDDLLGFARLPAHRQLMQWITRDTKNGTGGYIRLHVAPDEGVTR